MPATIENDGAPARSAEQGAVSAADDTGNGPSGAGSREALLHQLREKAGLGSVSQGSVPNLRGAQFHGADLSGLDLSHVDLTGADLSGTNLSRTRFAGARMAEANLQAALLERSEFLGADLTNADFSDSHGEGVGFGNADLTRALFFNARLPKATFTRARLRNADLRAADLRDTRILEADLRGADFSRAILKRADLEQSRTDDAIFHDADLREVRLRGLSGHGAANWIGADIVGVDFCGAYLVRRTIEDQNYLHEFRNQSRVNSAIYWVWWATSDCGRSFFRWGLWTFLLVSVFAAIYETVPLDYGDHPTILSSFYYSVVTLTTLGYGDVVPASASAQIVAMCEVTIGYVMLGGLLSIFANKMARRAD